MRRILALAPLGAILGCAIFASTAGAQPLKVLCQLKHLPPRTAALSRPGAVEALCQNRANIVVRPRNVAVGNCGWASDYGLYWFPGHIVTHQSVYLYNGIWYGQALIGYNNLSNGRAASEWDAVVPNVNSHLWDGGRGWYSQGGLIRTWLYSHAISRFGEVCATRPGEPQDYTWIP